MTISNQVDTFEAVMKDVRKLGETGGAGENARANMYIRLVRGAANGVVDTIKRDATGNEVAKGGRDHADIAYDAYVAGFAKGNGHNADTKATKTAALRAGIRLGQTHGDDAIELMNRTHVLYKELEGTKGRVQPFEAFYRVSLAQAKSTTRLTDDELRACIVRDPAERDAAAYLRTAVKALEKACSLDDTDDARNALEATKRALAAYMAEEQKAKDLAALAELHARLGIAA